MPNRSIRPAFIPSSITSLHWECCFLEHTHFPAPAHFDLSLTVFTPTQRQCASLDSITTIPHTSISTRCVCDPVFRCSCVAAEPVHFILLCQQGTEASGGHTVMDNQHVYSLHLVCFFFRLVCICEVWKCNIYQAPRAGLQLWPVIFLRLCSCCHCLVLSSEFPRMHILPQINLIKSN